MASESDKEGISADNATDEHTQRIEEFQALIEKFFLEIAQNNTKEARDVVISLQNLSVNDDACAEMLAHCEQKLVLLDFEELKKHVSENNTTAASRIFRASYAKFPEHVAQEAVACFCGHLEAALCKFIGEKIAALKSVRTFNATVGNTLASDDHTLAQCLSQVVDAAVSSFRALPKVGAETASATLLKSVIAVTSPAIIELLEIYGKERKLEKTSSEASSMSLQDAGILVDEIALVCHLANSFLLTCNEQALRLHHTPSKDLTALDTALQEIACYYVKLEEHCVSSSVQLAVAEASPSEMVDDVFYLLHKCLERSRSTSVKWVLAVTFNNALVALQQHVRDKVEGSLESAHKKLSAACRDRQVITNVLQSAKGLRHPLIDFDRFALALNNAEMARAFVCKLVAAVEPHLPSAEDPVALEMKVMAATLLGQVLTSVQSLCSVVLLPIREEITTGFMEQTYKLKDGEFEAACASSATSWVTTLVEKLQRLLATPLESLSPSTSDLLLTCVAAEVVGVLEAAVLTKQFNEHGGVRVAREIRQLYSFFAGQCACSLRQLFNRLTHVAFILNMAMVDEVNDFVSAGSVVSSSPAAAGAGPATPTATTTAASVSAQQALLDKLELRTWLNADEIRAVLGLRVDFNCNQVARIRINAPSSVSSSSTDTPKKSPSRASRSPHMQSPS